MTATKTNTHPIISARSASLQLGGRTIWQDLSLDVSPGEFVAILGPNGSGKSSFLRTILGLQSLSSGTIHVDGKRPSRGSHNIGYIPQQKSFDSDLPIRGRDLVRFGLDGHKFGFPAGSSKAVQRAIHAVGAERFADRPIGRLSGGEQQRLRVAQALISNPKLLLCDEPLLSLDLSQQQSVSALIDQRRHSHNTAVLFVTHDINPILHLVDRVLYLVNGRWVVGKPEEVLTTETLTQLYDSPIEVFRIKGRIIVMGAGESLRTEPGNHHHHHGDHHE